jgi:hypothetical protein
MLEIYPYIFYFYFKHLTTIIPEYVKDIASIAFLHILYHIDIFKIMQNYKLSRGGK